MRIPPYWAKEIHAGTDRKGRKQTFSAWGWSFDSLSAARDDAANRARRVFERVLNGQPSNAYDYLDRPMREEIIDTVRLGSDEIAMVTRNRYGALVLNAAGVCFVDVDFPRLKAQGFLDGLLLGFSPSRKRMRLQAIENDARQRVEEWASQHPQSSFRMYRTAAGLRLLFTDHLYDPVSAETTRLFRELDSDPLYQRLTAKQGCFRARLTPKPYRCDFHNPPNCFPRENPKDEKRYQQWLREYEQKRSGYTTCQLFGTFGSGLANPHIEAIVNLHDRHACGESDAPLA